LIDDADSKRPILTYAESALKLATAVIGIFYLGLLITNVQLMALGVVDFSALQSRNVLVGFLFAVGIDDFDVASATYEAAVNARGSYGIVRLLDGVLDGGAMAVKRSINGFDIDWVGKDRIEVRRDRTP